MQDGRGRALMAKAAAVGVCVAYLPLLAGNLAFQLDLPNLGWLFFFITYWSLRIFVPLLNAVGLKSVWMPHPLAFIASLGFAGVFYTLLAYAALRLWAKIKPPPLP